MGGTYSISRRDEKCIQTFNVETQGDGTTFERWEFLGEGIKGIKVRGCRLDSAGLG